MNDSPEVMGRRRLFEPELDKENPRSENLLSKKIWGNFRDILRNQVSFPYFRKKESIMRSRGVWDSTPPPEPLTQLDLRVRIYTSEVKWE